MDVVSALPAAARQLAAEELNEYTVTPGILGFIVFAVLGVAVWILLRSMSRHLGRIDFEEPGSGTDGDHASPSA